MILHVRNGSYRTSGNDQRQEREGDKQGVWHRMWRVVQYKDWGGLTSTMKTHAIQHKERKTGSDPMTLILTASHATRTETDQN